MIWPKNVKQNGGRTFLSCSGPVYNKRRGTLLVLVNGKLIGRFIKNPTQHRARLHDGLLLCLLLQLLSRSVAGSARWCTSTWLASSGTSTAEKSDFDTMFVADTIIRATSLLEIPDFLDFPTQRLIV